MTRSQQLDELKAQIVTDKVCPVLAAEATQLVFGDGNPEAEIVFIGEAPGKKEDLQGIPFVGAAGKFLNEMLSMINLKREDIYITNIVKYRPPNNRDPLPEEKAAFLPYLKKQLSIIAPKLIVTLGRHSMDVLLPRVPTCASCKAGGSCEPSSLPGGRACGASLKISQVHGQPMRYQESVYMPLFHPAAVLYNRSLRQTLIDDFAKIPPIIENFN